MKYYFIAFCLFLGSLLPIEAQTIRQIEVSFPILKGKMKLQGVVSQVAEAPQQSPILVLVTPPQASNRDYVGFFKALSDSLNRKGYTTFRYDTAVTPTPFKEISFTKVVIPCMMQLTTFMML